MINDCKNDNMSKKDYLWLVRHLGALGLEAAAARMLKEIPLCSRQEHDKAYADGVGRAVNPYFWL